jgi:cellulose synthase operon protein C
MAFGESAVESPSIRSVKIRKPLLRPVLRALLLSGALAAAGTCLAATDPKASQFYEDALVRYEKKDMAGAIIQLKNAIKIDRRLLPVHVLLGKALLANSEVVAAEVAFSEALRLGVNRAEVVVPMARAVVAQGQQQRLLAEPQFATAGLPAGLQSQLLLVMAAAAADMGDAKAAIKAIDESRAVDASSADAWLVEVPIRIRARQFKEAVAAVDKALQLAPGSAEATYLQGSVLHVTGNASAALAAYDRALQIQPDHAEALVARAGLLMDLNRGAEALRDVNALRKALPHEPRGAYLKALLSERDGNGTAARAALNDLTGLLDPVPIDFMRYRPQLLMLGGLAHFGLGQREKAKPYLEAVQRSQPNSAVSKLLAQIYLAEKNTDRAIESLDLYLKARPDDAQALTLLASAHMSQGRHARATQIMQDALKRRDAPELRTTLGLSLASSNKAADAIAQFEAVYRKDDSQLQAGSALAMLYLQGRQSNKAAAVADNLVQRQPKNAGFHNLLGMARAQLNQIPAARAAFEQAVKLDQVFVAPQINLARLDSAALAYDAAAARLNAVLKGHEKNLEALMEMGLMAERRGQMAEAQRWLEKASEHSTALELGPSLELVSFHLRSRRADAALEATKRLTAKAPEDLAVLLVTARAQIASANADAARSSLLRATKVANFDPPKQVEIALLQLAINNVPGAAYSLDKALAGQSDFLPALALMTDVEVRQGELIKAEQRARQIAARNPKLAIGATLIGDVALARGQRPAALDAYRRAQALEPSRENLLRLFNALASGDAAAAVQLAEQWLKAHPQDTVVRRALGDQHARSGNYGAARAAYEAQLKSMPDDSEALNNLANVMLLTKDPAAQKTADQALARNPEAPHIIGTAGWAAFKAGRTDRALQLLRDARLRDPANADTRYFLAAVLASAGRHAEAREELETALRGGRFFASAKDADALLRTLK